MAVKLSIASATVRALVHATEDVERVRRTVRALVGDETGLRETRSRGYHKQSLRIVEAEVRGARDIRDLVGKLGTDAIVADYVRTWELRLDADEGVVHFRLAKQPLLEGRVELEVEGGEGDLVKVELKLLAYPAKPESYRKVAEGLFEITRGGPTVEPDGSIRGLGNGIMLVMFSCFGIGLLVGLFMGADELIAYPILGFSTLQAVVDTRIVSRYEIEVEFEV